MGITKARACAAVKAAEITAKEKANLLRFIQKLPDDQSSPLHDEMLAFSDPNDVIVEYLLAAQQDMTSAVSVTGAGVSGGTGAAGGIGAGVRSTVRDQEVVHLLEKLLAVTDQKEQKAVTGQKEQKELLEKLVAVSEKALLYHRVEHNARMQLSRSRASTQAEDEILKFTFIDQVLGGLTLVSYQHNGVDYTIKTVTCEVLGIKIPVSMTKLAHLLPFARRHESEYIFNFKNINCNRNLMVTYRAIEEWFDENRLTLVCGKGSDPYTLELLHLTDPSLAEELFLAKYAYSQRGTPTGQLAAELEYARSVCAGELAIKLGKPATVQPKLKDLHKMQVVFQRTKVEDRPFRRVLWARSHEAAEAAIKLGWITEQDPLSELVLQLAEHGSPGSDMATVRAWFLKQTPATFGADADGGVDVPAESEESLECSGSFAG